MKMKFYAVLFLFSIPFIGRSQQNPIFEIQSGISFLSEIPSRVKTYNGFSKIDPFVGFSYGISKSWNFKNHLFIRSGVLCQKSGMHGQSVFGYSVISRTNNVCVPIIAGYIIKLGNYHPSVYIGIRPNFNVSNSVINKTWYNNKISVDSDKDIFNEYLVGFSIPFGKHFLLDLNYNYGYNIYYMEMIRFPIKGVMKPISVSYYMEAFPSSEFAITFFYKFYKKSNKNFLQQ